MAYAGTELTIHAPDTETVSKKHPAGICASFTCDWLKKLLAKKPLSDLTYQDAKRINKLVKRQKQYEKANNLEDMFKSYGLSFESDRPVDPKKIGEFFDGLPGGYYYVSIKFENGFGHSLGYDAHGQAFCDPNLGVMTLNGLKMSKMVKEAIAIYGEEAGALEALFNVAVVLKK